MSDFKKWFAARARNPDKITLEEAFDAGASAQQRVQLAPSVPDSWLRAIDEALVVAHLGVAEAEDGYEEARRKLNELICWHVTVATDPAVNGGWKLVPAVSTYEMDNAGSEHCDGYLSTAQVVWDAMLAAAPKPEAKP